MPKVTLGALRGGTGGMGEGRNSAHTRLGAQNWPEYVCFGSPGYVLDGQSSKCENSIFSHFWTFLVHIVQKAIR